MIETGPQHSEDGIELAPGVRAPESGMRWNFARSSGPGGQNVNKVNTKAEVWVAVTSIVGLRERAVARLRELSGRRLTIGDEIHIASDSERSQEANRAEVLQRLRELLIEAMREPRKRRKTRPSKAARQRRLGCQKAQGQRSRHSEEGGD